MDNRHFMYVLRPLAFKNPDEMTETHQRIARSHFEYLERLVAEDTVIMAGRTEGAEMGIVVFQAPSEERALGIMQSDPAVRHGLMSATLYPYRLSLLRGAPA